MDWGVLAQRAMCPRIIVVDGIATKRPAQMAFPEHDQVVDAFPSDRADQPLRLPILNRINQVRPKPNHPDHEGTIATVQPNPLRCMPQFNVQLMPEKQNLGFKPTARLQQVDEEPSKAVHDRKHPIL